MISPDNFASAYSHYFAKTCRFLTSQGAPCVLAEDLAQEAWARGWERRHQLNAEEKVGSWVNTIALNLFRSGSFSNRSLVSLEENFHHPIGNKSEVRAEVRRLLAGATKGERKLLILYAVEGMTSHEIGQILDMSPIAVRVRIHRLKKRIQQRLASRLTTVNRARATRLAT